MLQANIKSSDSELCWTVQQVTMNGLVTMLITFENGDYLYGGLTWLVGSSPEVGVLCQFSRQGLK